MTESLLNRPVKLPGGDEAIGITEITLEVTKTLGEDVRVRRFNLHILYSLWGDDTLVARCLDLNMNARMDLRKELDIRGELTDTMASDLTRDLTRSLCDAISDYIILVLADERPDLPIAYMQGAYWDAFRIIRQARDIADMKYVLAYPEESIEPFLPLDVRLQQHLPIILKDDGYKTSIVDLSAFMKRRLQVALEELAA